VKPWHWVVVATAVLTIAALLSLAAPHLLFTAHSR
jgi:hypothetical protein